MTTWKTKDETGETLEQALSFLESKRSDRLVNAVELQAITAMLTYTAMTQKKDVETVLCILTTAFDVLSIQQLTASRYDEAIHYLMETEIQTLLH